jgi:hypothetical protein
MPGVIIQYLGEEGKGLAQGGPSRPGCSEPHSQGRTYRAGCNVPIPEGEGKG